MKVKIFSKLTVNNSQTYYRVGFKDTNGEKRYLHPIRSYITKKDFVDDLKNQDLKYDVKAGDGPISQKLVECIDDAENKSDLNTIRVFSNPTYTDGALITQFGCFGKRSKGSRPDYVRDFQEQKFFNSDELVGFLKPQSDPAEQHEAFQPLLEASSSLTICYLAAIYSSLLLMLSDQDGFDLNGFTLVASGKGGSGKTSLCLAAHSIVQKAKDEKVLLSLSSGDGTIHDELPARCGTIVGIGDVKSAKYKGAKLLDFLQSYLFSGVEGLARKRKTDKHKLKYTSPLVFILPIEESLTALHKQQNRVVQEGDRRRVIEMPILPRAKGGIFDLKDSNKSGKLIHELKLLAANQDGSIMNDWVTAYNELEPDHVGEIYRECCEEYGQEGHWCQRERGTKLYDLVADNLDRLWFAARLLDEVEQLPVTIEHVAKCLRVVDKQNRKIISGRGNLLQRQIKRKILDLFKNEDLFPKVKTGENVQAKSKHAIGFIRKEKSGDCLYILPKKFRANFKTNEQSTVEHIIKSNLRRGFGKMQSNAYTTPIKQAGFVHDGSKRPRCWILHVDATRKPKKR